MDGASIQWIFGAGLWRRSRAVCRVDRRWYGSVSAASAVRWQQLANQHGTPAPQQQGGDRRSMRLEARAAAVNPLLSAKEPWPK